METYQVVMIGFFILAIAASIEVISADDVCREVLNCKRCPRNVFGTPICEECLLPNFYVLDKEVYPPVCRDCQELEGCLMCSSTKKCDLCAKPSKEGPDLSGKGTCSPCADNCNYCGDSGSKKCDACKSGYQLTDKQLCSRCSSNCDSCLSPSFCILCNPGFFKNSNKGCSACPENCMECLNDNICLSCSEGYTRNIANKCISKKNNQDEQ